MSGDVVELCACDRCAKPVAYDLDVPDDVWGRISPRPVDGWKSGGVLCPDCVLAALITSQERLTKDFEDYLVRLSAALGGISRYSNEQGDYRALDDWAAFLLKRTETLRLDEHSQRRLLAEARAALRESLTALEAAEDRDERARFRANSPRQDQEVRHLRTSAIRTAARTLTNGGENGR